MYAVIDIGSNSIRLMFHNGERTIMKMVKTTRLAEGLAETGMLSDSAIERSLKAVTEFIAIAKERYNIFPYIFATEAVRSASNGYVLTTLICEKCDALVDIVSGTKEAELGFAGVYTSGTICVVDIGGASTEIIVGNNKGINYSKSLKIGAVRLKDICGEDEEVLDRYLTEQLKKYGNVPKADEVVAIGGTAGTIVAITLGMKEYESSRVHNYILKESVIASCYNMVRQTPLEKRKDIIGLMAGREEIIVGAMYELLLIMRKLGVDKVRVSESDNLEGYLKTCILVNK